MEITGEVLIPVVTAAIAAIPAAYAGIKLARSNYRAEEEKFRKSLLVGTQDQLEKLSRRVELLEQEKHTCEKKLAYVINKMALAGLLEGVTDELGRIEEVTSNFGRHDRYRRNSSRNDYERERRDGEYRGFGKDRD